MTAISDAPPTLRSRRLGPLIVVFLTLGLSTALSFPFLSLFLTTAVHAGPVELTVFLLAQPLSGVAVSTVLGRLSDGRVARRRVLMGAAAAACAGAALFAVLRGYWPLLIVGCTLSAVAGALMPQGFAFARASLAGDPTAPMVTSTLRMFFSLAWVGGPPLASLILNAGGFTSLFACSSALYAVVIVVVARWFVEPPPTQSSADDDGAAGSASTEVTRRALWITIIALVSAQAPIALNVQLLPLLIRHNLHAGVGSAGVILGICAGLEIPAMFGFGVLTKRVPLRLLITIGPLFGIAYYGLAAAAGQVWQLGAAQIIDACYIAVFQGLAVSYVQELLPLHPGRASTLYSNTFIWGIIVAGPVLGIGAKFGYRISYVVAAGLSAAALVLLIAGRPSRVSSAAPVSFASVT